jgi:hypothetical protein
LEPSSGTIDRLKWHACQSQETGRIGAGRKTLDENLFHHIQIRFVMVMIVSVAILRQMWRLPLGRMRRCPVIVAR